jgi:hypothetical protein
MNLAAPRYGTRCVRACVHTCFFLRDPFMVWVCLSNPVAKPMVDLPLVHQLENSSNETQAYSDPLGGSTFNTLRSFRSVQSVAKVDVLDRHTSAHLRH